VTILDIYCNWDRQVNFAWFEIVAFLYKCNSVSEQSREYFHLFQKKLLVLAYFFLCTVFSEDNPHLYIIVLVNLVLLGTVWASRSNILLKYLHSCAQIFSK